jgi:hypothetical protein
VNAYFKVRVYTVVYSRSVTVIDAASGATVIVTKPSMLLQGTPPQRTLGCACVCVCVLGRRLE